MAITIVPTPNPYTVNSISSVDWKFVAPYIDFYWNPSDAPPGDFQIAVQFPDYTAIPTLALFTDWKFEADLVHQSTVIFTTSPVIAFSDVNGVQNYQGPIGTVTGSVIDKVLTFGFLNLSLLPVPTGFLDFSTPRAFDCTAKCRVTAINPDNGLRETISEKDFSFKLHRRDMFLGSSPISIYHQNYSFAFDFITGTYVQNPMIFNFHTGGSLPSLQDLFVFRPLGENTAAPPTFVISDASIQTTFTAIHAYYAKFVVDFDSSITGLAIGQYNYSITLGYPAGVTYPAVEIVVPIQLNILPPVGALYITPSNLDFNVVVGGAAPVSQMLSLQSANPWNVVGVIPSWLDLSQYSGSGNATLLANIINYINLPAATYTYTLTITDGTDTITVDIVLNLSIFCISPFVSGGLYFTQELDYLKFTSQNLGTYVEIKATITTYSLENFTPKVYTREFKLPLFQKEGDFHLGTIVHQLFADIEELDQVVPSTSLNYSTTQYKPAFVDVTWEEKEYIVNILTPPVLITGGVLGFKMVKGHKPFTTNGNLSLLSVQQQNFSRITRNGVIGVTYTHFGMPQVIVKVNSITVNSFNIAVTSSDKPLYSYFRFANSFQIGDVVEIIILNTVNEIRTQRYQVVRDGLASTHILFENDNGIMEPFEFTGKRLINSGYKFATKQKFKNLFKTESKAVSNNLQSVTVNSGDLMPNDNKIIDAIIKSENVWMSFNDARGPYIRVDATTSKVTAYDSEKNELNQNVEFNILEDSDAKVYPQ